MVGKWIKSSLMVERKKSLAKVIVTYKSLVVFSKGQNLAFEN